MLWNRVPAELAALADAWTAADRQPPRGVGESALQTLAVPPELRARLYE
ncbi:hypothetical protein [Nannocystis sp. SCPEA4]|nr:hypothetical protein [Nannocystis sp. SCPEA4]MCY1060800.1 hypothetical protein [Nannocystis sp. SCPEA4]